MGLTHLDWPIRTDRLQLRPVVAADVPAIFEYRSRREVSQWTGGENREIVPFTTWFLERTDLDNLVVERDGTVIGDLMLSVENAWAQREVADDAANTQATLGWTFDPAHQGQGLATEAVSALIDLCFGPLGLRRVRAECFSDNEPSWRLMERLGMRREAHFVKDSLHRDLGWLDEYVYGLLASEWRGQPGG